MQQKVSPASVLLADTHTGPPRGKIQEERWFYPDLLLAAQTATRKWLHPSLKLLQF